MADQGNISTPDAADLDAAAHAYCVAQGWAMPDGSYPIRPMDMHGRDDLTAAVHAVGRSGAEHDAVRRHIMARARALGLSSLIPDNWNPDGSMRGIGDMDIERRFTPVPVEARALDTGQRTIGGYAAVFNSQSRNLGGFVETIDPVSFNKSRGDGWPEVIARYNHDDNMLLGTTAAKTLRISVDAYGLAYEVDPPQARSDILELVERGDVRKSSFAFRTVEDEWSLTDQGYPLRTLRAAQLVDVAPVNIPAYSDTTAGLRSLARHVHADVEEVRSLAEVGDLRKFFVRTDNRGKPVPTRTTLAAKARMELLGKRTDPWAGQ